MKLPFDDSAFETWTEERDRPVPKSFPGRKYPDGFYMTAEWRTLRSKVLDVYGRQCMCCGKTKGEIHVDHIRPRSRYPELALEFSNLQVLCRGCNFNKDTKIIDYRVNKSYTIKNV